VKSFSSFNLNQNLEFPVLISWQTWQNLNKFLPLKNIKFMTQFMNVFQKKLFLQFAFLFALLARQRKNFSINYCRMSDNAIPLSLIPYIFFSSCSCNRTFFSFSLKVNERNCEWQKSIVNVSSTENSFSSSGFQHKSTRSHDFPTATVYHTQREKLLISSSKLWLHKISDSKAVHKFVGK
jgi:hypothetical protein